MMAIEREDIIKSWVSILVQTPRADAVAKDPTAEAARIFEESLEGMKEILRVSLQRNTDTYLIIGSINLVMVGIGVVFVGISIGYSIATNRIDEITLSSAGLAAADFAAIFLINPQERIRKSLTNFVQLGIICHSWSSRTQASFVLFLKSRKEREDVQLFQKTIDEIADDAVHAIEESVEK